MPPGRPCECRSRGGRHGQTSLPMPPGQGYRGGAVMEQKPTSPFSNDRVRDEPSEPEPPIAPSTETTFRHDPPVGGDVTEPAPAELELTSSREEEYSLSDDAAPSVAVRPQTPLGVPRDHLPGDAAPAPMGFAPAIPDDPDDEDEDAKPPSNAPRRGTFTILATIWLACWFGVMFLVLNHRFDRKMDWNTSYFSIAARNLVREGFVKQRGGIYLTAGQGFELSQKEFYPGHPPL